jgi:hypothetical protein
MSNLHKRMSCANKQTYKKHFWEFDGVPQRGVAGGRRVSRENVHHGGGAPARGLNGNLLQLEFKIQANFGASNGASWGPARERIMAIGRSPVICGRAA